MSAIVTNYPSVTSNQSGADNCQVQVETGGESLLRVNQLAQLGLLSCLASNCLTQSQRTAVPPVPDCLAMIFLIFLAAQSSSISLVVGLLVCWSVGLSVGLSVCLSVGRPLRKSDL